MNTFSLKELRDCLIDKNAFIAHCAGYAKGVGNNQTDRYSIFERIHHAIFDDIEISCSTIVPGDNFQGNNYTGTLGIILFPKAPNSITFASCSDSGTSIDIGNPTRRKYKNIKSDISLENIQKCILDRNKTDYNEFCILAYHVVGVLLVPQFKQVLKRVLLLIQSQKFIIDFHTFHIMCSRVEFCTMPNLTINQRLF